MLVFLLCCTACGNEYRYPVALKINWDIKMPIPSSVETIYTTETKDGEDFDIWRFDRDIKLPKEFQLITEENLSKAEKSYLEYQNAVEYDDENFKKLTDNFDKDVLSCGNYYVRQTQAENEDSYILMYYHVKTCTLYYLSWIM